MQELIQTDLQFTAGGIDEDGTILAVNCNCFYLADQGPEENPPGSLWRIVAADEVPEGAETARTVGEQPQPAEPEAEDEDEEEEAEGGQQQ
jgi:hypothetical protein